MSRKLGIYSSLLTVVSVLSFAVCMLAKSGGGSYVSSLFISWGIVALVCSYASTAKKESRAASYTAMAFAVMYGVIIALIYFAQLTTVRTGLTGQAEALLDYNKFGLFFNYNLLGYGFMALSVFFTALTIRVKDTGDKWLRMLMLIHGIFFVSGLVIPMLGLFRTDMAGGDLAGVIVLEFWCAYFIPIGVLSFRYFMKNN